MIKQPSAYVLGKPFHDLPKDLYIPPNALEVILESFTGPLDLLLYLIKKENINILDISIAQVTAQYVSYVDLIKNFYSELAAEYLVMAATLAEIKSKMLLPKQINSVTEEIDPRAELVRQLREYEQFKKVAEDIEFLPRVHREIFPISTAFTGTIVRSLPKLDIQNLFMSLKDVYVRVSANMPYRINKYEGLSVGERMTKILIDLNKLAFMNFEDILKVNEGRLGAVIAFIAILELSHQNLLEIIQEEIYGLIFLKKKI
ncbi:MAG: segregation/condensation protein A [Coxiellaceae bacterium]|nr:segregation/condensation protein A [Coxiellaceae bacterium]